MKIKQKMQRHVFMSMKTTVQCSSEVSEPKCSRIRRQINARTFFAHNSVHENGTFSSIISVYELNH